MTVLESYSDRQNIGIDSFERALLYSAILLNKANIDPNNFVPASSNPNFTAVELNTNISEGTTSQITGKVNLTYANFIVLEDGINHFDNIDVFGFTNPNPLNILCPESDARFMELIPEPNDITTIERYFYWLVTKIKNTLVKFQPDVSQLIKIKFNPRFKDTVGRVVVEFALPISTTKYLSNYNVLCSVEPLLKFPVGLVAKDYSAFIFATNIAIKETTLRIISAFSSAISLTEINSSGKKLRIYRESSEFVLQSTILDILFGIFSSDFSVTESSTQIESTFILRNQSQPSYDNVVDILKSRSNPFKESSTPEYATEINTLQQFNFTEFLEGGWQAKVTIEVKPDLIENDLQNYPLFVHPEDIRKVFDLFVGKRPPVGTLGVWQTEHLAESFRAKIANTNELLPIYTATDHKKPDNTGYDEYTPVYYEGGIWILLPLLNSNKSTFIDLYFLDLFVDYNSSSYGSNIPYPANRYDVFNQYHWWSFYLREESSDSRNNMITNIGTASISNSEKINIRDNEDDGYKRYDLATNGNNNKHPFTVQSASIFKFADVETGFVITDPINITSELTTPTLQTWQIGEQTTPVEFGNLVLTSGDVVKASVSSENSRKISLNQNGGYFNDTFHNPRTIAPETVGSSPQFKISESSFVNSIFMYNQIKLHKQQLSFDWIKTEYNNEVNRSQFYEVKQIKYFSIFESVTEIDTTSSGKDIDNDSTIDNSFLLGNGSNDPNLNNGSNIGNDSTIGN